MRRNNAVAVVAARGGTAAAAARGRTAVALEALYGRLSPPISFAKAIPRPPEGMIRPSNGDVAFVGGMAIGGAPPPFAPLEPPRRRGARPQAEGAEPLPGMHSGRSVGPGCASLPRRRSERACAGVFIAAAATRPQGHARGALRRGAPQEGPRGPRGRGRWGGLGGAQQPRWAAAEQRELGWP